MMGKLRLTMDVAELGRAGYLCPEGCNVVEGAVEVGGPGVDDSVLAFDLDGSAIDRELVEPDGPVRRLGHMSVSARRPRREERQRSGVARPNASEGLLTRCFRQT